MKALQVILAITFAGVLIGLGAVGWAWSVLNSPAEHGMSQTIVKIAQGSTTDQVIQTLNESGIIRDPLIVKIYIKLKKGTPLIRAGDYLFPSPISPIAALKELESGGIVPYKFTIIEGWTRWDVANALASLKALKLASPAQALKLLDNKALIKDLDPKAANLEGYLFPDTYAVHSDTSAQDIVASAVKRFKEIWDSKLREPAKARGLSPHEVVTIASIIETEAKLDKDRPVVSSVIYNRLRKKMNLSVDSTIIYASKLAGKWRNDGKVYMSDINRESPYNTRKVLGLPPGPVGNPGLASLEAVLHPIRSDYIYYVRDPAQNNGAHTFYSDAASFELGVQKLRNWEAARDAKLKKQAK